MRGDNDILLARPTKWRMIMAPKRPENAFNEAVSLGVEAANSLLDESRDIGVGSGFPTLDEVAKMNEAGMQLKYNPDGSWQFVPKAA